MGALKLAECLHLCTPRARTVIRIDMCQISMSNNKFNLDANFRCRYVVIYHFSLPFH